MKASVVDVDYVREEEEGKTVGHIILTLFKDGEVFTRKVRFDPYFYFDGELPKEVRNVPEIKDVVPVKKRVFFEEREVTKVVCYNPADIPSLREMFSKFGKTYEADIPFVRRFMVDTGIGIFSEIEYVEDGEFIEIKKVREGKVPPLKKMAFDIETYNPYGVPREKEDPVIIISMCRDGRGWALTYRPNKVKGVKTLEDERAILEEFVKEVRKTDLLYGYNSTTFDLPYLRERADINKVDFGLGRDGSPVRLKRKGAFSIARINGRLHVDVFHMVRFLAGIGALKTNTYTLKEVYKEIFGEGRRRVEILKIWEMWNSEKERDELLRYAIDDAESTFELGERFLPMFVEIAKTVNITLEDAVSSTTGQLVEHYLFMEAQRRGVLVPNKPSESEVMRREREPIEGAFVKLPEPGVYERIAVLDFRSLYPSIIISHNISPETLNCECCKDDGYKAPTGVWFCKRRRGIIPETLRTLIEKRAKLKKQLKSLDPDSEEYKYLYARQYAYKIIANSFYGMLRYVRARWYCRECASATTAWARKYIKDVMEKAEKEGFEVLYGDTDSVFLLMGKKSKDDVISFMNSVNRELPDVMELELEDFYTRGIFVSKKGDKAGAKKKYALLSEDGKIKIRGFELVRRDWSEIARETQRKVLEIMLKEGDRDKAVNLVREVIDKLKKEEVPLSKTVIYTRLSKPIEEYKSIGPEVSAAIKAIKKGMPVGEGSLIGYVITKGRGSISERAEPEQFAKDYDPEYYIEHQVLPAVEKILGGLGFDREEAITGKKQAGLDQWL